MTDTQNITDTDRLEFLFYAGMSLETICIIDGPDIHRVIFTDAGDPESGWHEDFRAAIDEALTP